MRYILWLYVASLSNRLRNLGRLVFRLSVIAIAVEYLLLAQPTRPGYSLTVQHWLNQSWLYFWLSGFVILFPSREYVLGVQNLLKRDNFLRNNVLIKILRLLKLVIKHDLLLQRYRQSLYQRIVTVQRLKWLAVSWYVYDVYRGYKRPWQDLCYLITAYFGFVCASWLYVRYSGAELYYYPTIANSLEWGIAIMSFLILKVLFFPDFGVLMAAAVKVGSSVLIYKLGIAKLESRLDLKLAEYPRKYGEQDA